jgi:hypothetical protein
MLLCLVYSPLIYYAGAHTEYAVLAVLSLTTLTSSITNVAEAKAETNRRIENKHSALRSLSDQFFGLMP